MGDYVTPTREHSKPPQFASKTAVLSKADHPSRHEQVTRIEEVTPIFLLDKGTKFFANGDYQSAINAFAGAIALDPQYLEAYSSRFQCHIEVIINSSEDLQYDEKCIADDVAQMKTLVANDRHREIADFANMVISLQNGIMCTPIVLDKLRDSAQDVDGKHLLDIKDSLDSGLKQYRLRETAGTLENTFG